MTRRTVALLAAAAALAVPATANAGGGHYVFDGGSRASRAQVRAALAASSFDWSVVNETITIHIERGVRSEATVGELWLDSDLLASRRFAWGTIQHEYAHQVDYFLLTATDRAALGILFGAPDWCYGVAGLHHDEYGCEQFASTLAWSYWQSPKNTLRPTRAGDEAAALPPAEFRAVISKIIAA